MGSTPQAYCSSALLVLRLHRQLDEEGRSLSYLALHRDPAMVLFDDPPGDGEPQTGAGPFPGKERLEDQREVAGFDAGAIVGYGYGCRFFAGFGGNSLPSEASRSIRVISSRNRSRNVSSRMVTVIPPDASSPMGKKPTSK